MTLGIEVGWTTADIGTFSISVTDTGATDEIVSLPAGTYCHTDISSVVPSGGYADAASAWETALNASGLDGTFTVAWSHSTKSYAIASDVAFSMAYTGEAVLRGMHSMGFSSAQGSSLAQASDNDPWYFMDADVGAASAWTGEYEPDGIVEESIADDGTPFTMSKPSSLNYLDFEIRMEPKARVFITESTTPIWTWEDFIRHTRGKEPMLFVDGVKSRVLLMRAGAARFRPTPAFSDWDELWNLGFGTRQLGTL